MSSCRRRENLSTQQNDAIGKNSLLQRPASPIIVFLHTFIHLMRSPNKLGHYTLSRILARRQLTLLMLLNNPHPLTGGLRNGLFLWVALVLLGAACNLMPVSLFVGMVLLLGETVIMLLAARFSMAATVLGALLVSLPAYLQWGHLWTTATYVTEAVFLAFFFRDRNTGVRTRNVILLLFLYWVTVGGAQTFVTYAYALGFTSIAAQVVVLRGLLTSVICGILYLVIDVLLRYNSSNPRSFYVRHFLPQGTRNFSVDLRELLVLAATGIVIVPLIIAMTYHNRERVRGYLEAEQSKLEAVTLYARERMEQWLSKNLNDPSCIDGQSEQLAWRRVGGDIHFSCPGDTQFALFDRDAARAILVSNPNPQDSLQLESHDLTLRVANDSVVFSTIAPPELVSHQRLSQAIDDAPQFDAIVTSGDSSSMLARLNSSSLASSGMIVPGLELTMTISKRMTMVQERIYFEYRSVMLYALGFGIAFLLASRLAFAGLAVPFARVSRAFAQVDPANPLATLNTQWPRSTLAQVQEFTEKLKSIIWAIEGAALEREALVNEMRSLIHNANSPIFAVDRSHRVNVWNHKMAEVTGFSSAEAEAAGKIEDFVAPGMQAQVRSLLDNAFEGRPTRNLEMPFLKRSGSCVELLLNLSLRRNAQGNIVSVVCLGQDMTELKAAQAQLVQTSKLASIGEMATSVAHELNQPLNVIRMATANCQRKVQKGLIDSIFLTEKLDRINSQVERAAHIIDHMRMFGRAAGDEPEPLKVVAVVNSALDMIDEQLRLDSIELRTDIEDLPLPVLGKQVQLEQVVLNLVSNARDALLSKRDAAENWISVSARHRAGTVEIIVEDSAGGIPADLMARIFDPFFTTKPAGKGTGLGLAISKKIIQEMKGHMRVENAELGARFTIVLPEAHGMGGAQQHG